MTVGQTSKDLKAVIEKGGEGVTIQHTCVTMSS
jgi:hypothetical protein